MKRYIKIISIAVIAVTILLLACSVSYANDSKDVNDVYDLSISQDFQTIHLDDVKYLYVDSSLSDLMLNCLKYEYDYDRDYDVDINVDYSNIQEEEIESIIVRTYRSKEGEIIVVYIYIEFASGSSGQLFYLKHDQEVNFSRTVNGKNSKYYTSITGRTDEQIHFEFDELSSSDSRYAMSGYKLQYLYTYPVYSYSDNGLWEIESGLLFKNGENWYYFDYFENGTTDPITKNKITLVQIDNPELVGQFENPLDKFDNGGFGVIVVVILSALVAIVPLAGVIASFIIASRSKKPYKSFLVAIGVICSIVLALIAALIIMVLIFA